MSIIFELPPGYGAQTFLSPSASRQRSHPDASIDLTLFISCYNEEEFIVETIERVCAALHDIGRLSFELIVIDDCSTDNSVALVKEYIAGHPEEPLILRCNEKNRGLSQNYVDASFFGIGTYYRLVCGDTSEPIETMKAIYSAIGSADMILPYYPQSVAGKSLIRRMISATYVAIINILTGQKLHYYNGLAIHRRFHVMRWHPTTRGFGFPADIICMLLEQGYSFKEIPVSVTERKLVNSTALTWSNFLSIVHTATNVIIRRLSRRLHEGGARRPVREIAKPPEQLNRPTS